MTDRTLKSLEHDKLIPGAPLTENPRGAMDNKALSGLAASIAEYGLRSPLEVRPAADGNYRIVFGVRRWTAIGQLIAAGKWSGPIPCLVDEADTPADAAFAIALVENLQREDLSPMDEARAFARLRDEFGWNTAQIAARIGKTRRHVQLRLQLVDGLAPTAQSALENGKIELAQARVIATLPTPDMQKKAVELAQNGWQPDHIRNNLVRHLPPVWAAAFPLSDYNGAFVEPDSSDGDRLFADAAEFFTLQRAAAEKQVEALKAEGWRDVRLVDRNAGERFDGWKFQSPKKITAKIRETGFAVVEIDDVSGQIHTHHKAAPENGDRPTRDKAPAAAFTKAHLARANEIKTEALRRALIRDPNVMLRAVVVALAGGRGLGLRVRQESGGHSAAADAAQAAAPRELQPGTLATMGADETAKAFGKLQQLPNGDVLELLAAFAAPMVAASTHFEPGLGADPIAVALSDACRLNLSAELKDMGALDFEYFAGLKRDRLIEILEIVAADEPPHKLDLAAMTAQQLRDECRARADAIAELVPRELRLELPETLALPLEAGGKKTGRRKLEPKSKKLEKSRAADTVTTAGDTFRAAAGGVDDPFDLGMFDRRGELPANKRPAVAKKPKAKKIAMPKKAARKKRKAPGMPKQLAALGFKPAEIKRLDRRVADELIAQQTSAADWRARQTDGKA